MFKQAKIRQIHGLKVRGNKEKFYIESLVSGGTDLPRNCTHINTPIGRYTPDFEYDDYYVEIKGGGTWKVLLGKESYIRGGKCSDLQWRKIQWVASNVKPIKIFIICNNMKTKDNLEIPDSLPPNIELEILIQ